MTRTEQYDATLAGGYRWFNYPDFYTWLATQAKTIVEVGSWLGFSTVHLAKAMSRQPEPGWLYAVDLWGLYRVGCIPPFSEAFPTQTSNHIYACFLRNVRQNGVGDIVLPHRMASRQAARQFAVNQQVFDAVFLDGDHTREGVHADIQAWRPLVRPGGIIAGHDYHMPAVREAVAALLPAPVQQAAGCVWWLRLPD